MKICRWCGVKIRIWRRYCPDCRHAMFGNAGIYLQSGGPPYPFMSRLASIEHLTELLERKGAQP